MVVLLFFICFQTVDELWKEQTTVFLLLLVCPIPPGRWTGEHAGAQQIVMVNLFLFVSHSRDYVDKMEEARLAREER